MLDNPKIQKWYALSVFSRQEAAAIEHVRSLGIELFFPQRVVRRAWSDRVKSLPTPLFPGYLFIKLVLNASSRIELIRKKQILDVVGKKKIYTGEDIAYSIPEFEIESLKTLVSQREMTEPIHGLSKGQWVEIASGPLKGVFGTIQRLPDGKMRISVNITLLGRSICAEISSEDVVIPHPDRIPLVA